MKERFTIEEAVKVAFPGAKKSTIKTITQWYAEEGAADDYNFEELDDFIAFIQEDIEDMLEATDPEYEDIVQDLVDNEYVSQDFADYYLDEDDDDED